MKRTVKIMITAAVTAVILISASLSASSAKPKVQSNTFEHPDFAFPRDVISNAEKTLAKARTSDNGKEAVKAAIQLTIANNLISNDKAPEMAAMMDSLASSLPEPYSAVCYILEANLYKNIWENNRWTYSNRNLPLNYNTENPKEWSSDLFSLKILSLIKKAATEAENFSETPIMTIEPLLLPLGANSAPYSVTSPTLCDFIASQADMLLEDFIQHNYRLPFSGPNISKRPLSMEISETLDNLDLSCLRQDKKDGYTQAEISAILRMAARKTEWERAALLLSVLDKTKTEAASLRLLPPIYNLSDFSSSQDVKEMLSDTIPLTELLTSKKAFYDFSKTAVNTFPDTISSGEIRNIISNLSQPNISLSSRSQFLTRDSINIDVKLNNLNSTHILILKVSEKQFKKYALKDILTGSKIVTALPVKVTGSIPFETSLTLKCPSPGAGLYVAVPSSEATIRGIDPQAMNRTPLKFIVSDLSYIESICHSDNPKSALYVVDGYTQKPIRDARVIFEKNGTRNQIFERITDSEGAVSIPDGSFMVTIRYGKDINFADSYNFIYREKEKTTFEANIFTDLGIYHPGQTLQFAIILSKIKDRERSILPDSDATVILYDANHTPVDTLLLHTDKFGRANGEFTIPQDGLLGNYTIMTEHNNSRDSHSVEVAEYKAPSFFVTIDKTESSYTAGDSILLSGTALTYSGMPLAGAKVNYNIKTRRGYLRNYTVPDASYAGETITDAEGKFLITLDTRALKDTPFRKGVFALEVNVTDDAGETVQAPGTTFALGNEYSVSADIPELLKVEKDSVKLMVKVTDILGNPVDKTYLYTLVNLSEKREIARGEKEGELRLQAKRNLLPPGQYKLTLSIPGEKGSDFSDIFTLYYPDDQHAPCPMPVWMPERELTVIPGKNTIAKFGSGFTDSYLLYEIYDCEDLLERKWIKSNNDMKSLTLPAPRDNGRIYLNITGLHDLKGDTKTLTLLPQKQTEKLEIETLTFRDKITPMETEKWSFRLKYPRNREALPAMAVLSDKALNSLYPFNWSNPGGYLYYPQCIQTNVLSANEISSQFYFYSTIDFDNISAADPRFYTYGYSLYAGYSPSGYNSQIKVRGAATLKAPEPTIYYSVTSSAKQKVESDEAAFASADAGAINDLAAETNGKVGQDDAGDVPLRGLEHPLAFFAPDLTTTEDGTLEINFEVPDFNTTWCFQLLGYNPELKSKIITLETVASKPVMVSTLAPRFLRTGDSTLLKATVFNNSGQTSSITGSIEIFNPLTGEIISRTDKGPEELKEKESSIIEVAFRAPDNLNYIGIKAIASDGKHTDGEQSIITILPSSSPVIESTPFYLSDSMEKFDLHLPEYKAGDVITLQYCDNPVWVCLTALPDISMETNSSITSKITALYGTAIASGLTKKIPETRVAIEQWLNNPEDSVLISPLQKNQSLKLSALENTPWVRNGQSESLRMLRLGHLIDPETGRQRIKSLLADIKALQNSDGGFAWCPGMKSGLWTTERVLQYVGMLKNIGYLPEKDSFSEMTRRAITYCDNEILRIIRQNKGSFPYSSVASYLYIRSFYPEYSASAISNAKKTCLANIEKNWKKSDIYEAATMAILLGREKRLSTAKSILSSLSQKALHSPEKGMWFDNLKSGYNGFNSLITTARVLQAYSEIEPESPEIDALRQWLILSKQTEEWGDNPYTAEIINSILTTGSDWLTTTLPSRIYLNGREIIPQKSSSYIGEFSVMLPYSEASGAQLKIEKSGSHPAWGGVISQSIRPSAEIKDFSSGEITVQKHIYKVDEQTGASLLSEDKVKPGDKVRVMLTITTKRDMDYVMLTDERPACLAPIDQLSGYTVTDRTFYYKEVKNSCTNLFFDFLPKGVRQISYDCFVDRDGTYTDGIATIQSLYAPAQVAHSAGGILESGK